MLSNIGNSLVLLVLALSFLTIYTASDDLKTPGKTIKKIIYKLSLFQITFAVLSFFLAIIVFIIEIQFSFKALSSHLDDLHDFKKSTFQHPKTYFCAKIGGRKKLTSGIGHNKGL